MGVTIKDIAHMTGVSISTVSRVLNQSGPTSDQTRHKVLAAAAKHNYRPNTNARNLTGVQNKCIALLVKGITNPFFNQMIRVIEHSVALRGYSLMTQNVDGYTNEIDIAIQEAQNRNPAGVMIMGGSYAYTEDELKRIGEPCVLLTVSAGPDVDRSLYGSVTIDDVSVGEQAVEYLISLGHRRIGFIYNSPAWEKNTPNELRYMGYIRALEKHGIPFDKGLTAWKTGLDVGLNSYQVGFQACKLLMAANRDMTAIIGFADALALGAAKALLTMGLRIPEDISIIGIDGIVVAEYFHPSLDTIAQPAESMAQSSIEILFDMICGGSSRHIVYDCSLLKRGSCAPLTS